MKRNILAAVTLISIGLAGCSDEYVFNDNDQGRKSVKTDVSQPRYTVAESYEGTGSMSWSDTASAPSLMALAHDEYEDSPKGDQSTAEFE